MSQTPLNHLSKHQILLQHQNANALNFLDAHSAPFISHLIFNNKMLNCKPNTTIFMLPSGRD